MNKCNTCRANGICDHNRFGFETCGNYIPEWISVEERLPEEDTRVLVYLEIPKLDALTYTHCDTDRILYGKWVRWGGYATHWMPLPEPPKGE